MPRRRRSLGDLTPDQQREIADAPQVAPSPYAAVCEPQRAPAQCPPAIATPSWGDARTWYPSPACLSVPEKLAQDAADIPWWKLLLIAVGGVIAVREVLSD